MGNSLSGDLLDIVIVILSGLVAINLVLASALVTTIRQERARRARDTRPGSSGRPSPGPGSGSV